MVNAVLSYHVNPLTCGVHKFNIKLAERLSVPCLPLSAGFDGHPLLSVKLSEMAEDAFGDLSTDDAFDVFLHDWTGSDTCLRLIGAAYQVYAANRVIADAIRPYRPDVITAFCPSTINGNPHRGQYRVLAFGMAHKLALDQFRALKQQLDLEHPDYTVSLSTAVHEGSPWDTALTESTETMRAIFGDKLRVLGYLGDDALAKELQDCDVVAVYFDPALRANNTSYWAAVAAGKHVYTNTDADSPELDPVKYSWDNLVELLK